MEWLERCLAVRERNLSSSNVLTLNALHQRARLHLRLRDTAAALRDAQAAFSARNEKFGAAHVDTIESAILLAVVRSAISARAAELDDVYGRWLPALIDARGPSALVARAVALLAEYDPDSARLLETIELQQPYVDRHRFLAAWLSLLKVERQTASSHAHSPTREALIAQWQWLRVSQHPNSPRLERIDTLLAR